MNSSRNASQQCPICGSTQPLEATRCSECGAALAGLPPALSPKNGPNGRQQTGSREPLTGPPFSAWDEGEADLHEGMLPGPPLVAVIVGTATLALAVGLLLFFVVRSAGLFGGPTPTPPPSDTPTDVPLVSAFGATIPPTNTKGPSIPTVFPTLALATVTPAPPTATITPTRGPCMQKAAKGDTVYGMATRCGHKHLSIVDVIVALNGLKDANSLQEGQVLEIPWPTPTGGAQDGPTSAASSDAFGGPPLPQPTLPPGVTWYTVQKGDTAISVAYRFHMAMKALRDLNPEIQFLQCDFSLETGGPDCTLRPVLGAGQQVRVEAATPTPSLSPSPNGSETATPTGTATFNAPYSQSPDNNMLYESSDLPVLRWVASGQLDSNQFFLVTVKDTNAGATYHGTTRDLSFQVPASWQPTDGKPHAFEWSVALASNNGSGTPIPSALQTETRTFTWQSQ